MILVDGEKYACQQCIRGHRSSSCKHIKRTLVLVRSRGRPSTDSFQRIAIYAEELKDKDKIDDALKNEDNTKNNLLPARFIRNLGQQNPEKDSTPDITPLKQEATPSSCCFNNREPKLIKPEPQLQATTCRCCPSKSPEEPCKRNAVFILKATKRHVFNVEKDSLRLLDPVVEVPNSKVGLDIIQKVSKSKKLQSCRNKDMKKDYLQNVINNQSGSSCCGGGAINSSSYNNGVANFADYSMNNMSHSSFASMSSGVTPRPAAELNNESSSGSFYQFKVSIDKTKNAITDPSENENTVDSLMNNLQHVINNKRNEPVIYSDPSSTVNHNAFLYDLYVADSCTVPGSCSCEPDKCACPNCTEHGKYRNSNLTVKEQFEEFQFPSNNNNVKSFGTVEVQSNVPQFEQNFLKMLNEYSIETPTAVPTGSSNSEVVDGNGDDHCICEPDRCCCFNCEEHGIVDGVKQDGTFAGIPPFEIQLTNMQFPIDTSSSSLSTPTEQYEDDNVTSTRTLVTDRDQWVRQHENQFFNGNQSFNNFNR